MGGFLRGLFYGFLLIGVGWFVGSVYPAPSQFTAPIRARSDVMLAELDFSPAGLQRLRARLSDAEFAKLSRDAATLAASSGTALIVEHDPAMLEEHVDAIEAQQQEAAAPSAAAPAPGAGPFEDQLSLCPRMTVSNAPPASAEGVLLNYPKRVTINTVVVAVNPTKGACLSSMFGQRSGRLHKGIDLHSDDGGPILAAADGVVIEKKYRDDYGNMLLIDHGNGVYTRYSHLSSFERGVDVGARVTAGQQIGLMGNTASYRIPVHLHYEVLLGDMANPKGSFGLTPRSPFDFPIAG